MSSFISPEMLLFLPVLLFSIICHEVAHAYAAYRGGDDTARLKGRLSLNPIVHIDPIGTLLIPGLLLLTKAGFLFGWARPVPVNPNNLRSRRWDLVVSVAGVAANLALALIAALLLKILLLLGLDHGIVRHGAPLTVARSTAIVLDGFILINLVLIIFNLLPIPPLDGSHVLLYFARTRDSVAFRAVEFLQRFGFMILVILIVTGVLHTYILIPILRVALTVIGFVFQIPF